MTEEIDLENHFDVPPPKSTTTKILHCKYCGDTVHIIFNECICHEDQGCGYTFEDEYGMCWFCEGEPAVCSKCNVSRELEE